MNSSAKL